MASRHAAVGDARALGLYGVLEIVKDRRTKEPAADGRVKEIARGALDRGVHLATRWNYIFIAPPLCIEQADLVHGLDVIEQLLVAETE
jgi:taurine--2-oxoglutarate transaminase